MAENRQNLTSCLLLRIRLVTYKYQVAQQISVSFQLNLIYINIFIQKFQRCTT